MVLPETPLLPRALPRLNSLASVRPVATPRDAGPTLVRLSWTRVVEPRPTTEGARRPARADRGNSGKSSVEAVDAGGRDTGGKGKGRDKESGNSKSSERGSNDKGKSGGGSDKGNSPGGKSDKGRGADNGKSDRGKNKD